MSFSITKTANPFGPVILICKDEGTAASNGKDAIEVAILFPTRKEAEKYKEKVILGVGSSKEILPVRYP